MVECLTHQDSPLTNIDVWKHVSEHNNSSALQEGLPPHLAHQVAHCANDFHAKRYALHRRALRQMERFRRSWSRQEAAKYFETCDHPELMFAMLDSEPVDPILWKLVKPTEARPLSVPNA